MTQNEQLEVCKKCTNRKFEMETGIVCGLTNEKPNFGSECKDFIQDDNTLINQREEAAKIIAQLQSEQNLTQGIIAGVVAGIVGAVIWAAISVGTGYQIGYLAIGVGALVGFAIRFLGKGIDQIFGISGAVIAVLSCLIGNFLAIIGFGANEIGVSYGEVFSLVPFSELMAIMKENFSVIDLLFYFLAGSAGYRFAFRNLEAEE